MVDISVESILATARGFMESRVLLSAAELGVFDLLCVKPKTAAEVAEELGGDLRATTILLDALAALGYLSKTSDLYACPRAISRLLGTESSVSVLPMVLHVAGLWTQWSQLTDIVRRGSQADQMAPLRDDSQIKAFIEAMHVIGSRMAGNIVTATDSANVQSLLDVGGATGTYTEAFLKACPGMCATLFDLPPVIELARNRLAPTGLLDRISLVPGDFYRDEFPAHHDLVLLSAIIHQNSPAQNVELYKRAYRALNPGGRIVIRDHVMSPDHTKPAAGALFAVNMLVATPGGSTYSMDEIRETLTEAGFVKVRLLRSDERMNGLVEGTKPLS